MFKSGCVYKLKSTGRLFLCLGTNLVSDGITYRVDLVNQSNWEESVWQ